jgi:hypothetical protein
VPVGRSARSIAPRRSEVVSADVGAPAAGQARVRILACGVCASELHAWEGPLPAYPVVMGHEPAGIVEEIGPGVTGAAVGGDVLQGRVVRHVPAADHPRVLRPRVLHLPDPAVHADDPEGAGAGGEGRRLQLLQVFWHIVLPLCKPVLAVCVVFVFLGGWNDLLDPLIYLDSNDKFTVAIGMANMVTRANPNLNLLMAANLIMMIPTVLLYFFAQEKLIGGIASVGLKG